MPTLQTEESAYSSRGRNRRRMAYSMNMIIFLMFPMNIFKKSFINKTVSCSLTSRYLSVFYLLCFTARQTSFRVDGIKPSWHSVSSAQLLDLSNFGTNLHTSICKLLCLTASSESLISAKSSSVIIFV
jgi:hypothetical protein